MFGQIACHEQHEKDFNKFRWLQGCNSQCNPCARTELRYAQSRDINGQKKHDRSNIKIFFKTAEKAVVELLNKQQNSEPQKICDCLYPDRPSGFAEKDQAFVINGTFEHDKAQNTQ